MASKIDTIHVVDEQGHRTRVFKITSQIHVGSLAGKPEYIDGDIWYQLGDGTRLNRVEGGFEVPGGGGRFTLA